jgi:hypothetical protein
MPSGRFSHSTNAGAGQPDHSEHRPVHSQTGRGRRHGTTGAGHLQVSARSFRPSRSAHVPCLFLRARLAYYEDPWSTAEAGAGYAATSRMLPPGWERLAAGAPPGPEPPVARGRCGRPGSPGAATSSRPSFGRSRLGLVRCRPGAASHRQHLDDANLRAHGQVLAEHLLKVCRDPGGDGTLIEPPFAGLMCGASGLAVLFLAMFEASEETLARRCRVGATAGSGQGGVRQGAVAIPGQAWPLLPRRTAGQPSGGMGSAQRAGASLGTARAELPRRASGPRQDAFRLSSDLATE